MCCSLQVEEHNGHIFKSTQYSIPTYCEYCSSLIWMMDRACVCKCEDWKPENIHKTKPNLVISNQSWSTFKCGPRCHMAINIKWSDMKINKTIKASSLIRFLASMNHTSPVVGSLVFVVQTFACNCSKLHLFSGSPCGCCVHKQSLNTRAYISLNKPSRHRWWCRPCNVFHPLDSICFVKWKTNMWSGCQMQHCLM